MTLDKAIELLRANYKTALNLKWVRKPLAWALFCPDCGAKMEV